MGLGGVRWCGAWRRAKAVAADCDGGTGGAGAGRQDLGSVCQRRRTTGGLRFFGKSERRRRSHGGRVGGGVCGALSGATVRLRRGGRYELEPNGTDPI